MDTQITSSITSSRTVVSASPTAALAALARTILLSTDELQAQAMAPYIPGDVSELYAARALALFHERTGQHEAGVCSECGDLARFEPWARATLRRMAAMGQ